ncbi:MAG: nitroreductase family protein [Blautia sp.]|nr:nitroreductase family protein [Blautia sp.]
MDFMEMMLKRESCRSYADKAVSREDLLKIVEAGHLSPSACNSQPWKFIVVDDKLAKERLCDALVLENGKTSCPFRNEVPAFIVIVEQPARLMPAAQEYYQNSQYFAQGDIGMAAMNMCCEAVELGLATCMIGMNNQEKMEQYFNIPKGQIVRLVLTVGYAADEKEPRKKMRKALEDVYSFNAF